jgi:proteasome lid subunit RPN8/RPN11
MSSRKFKSAEVQPHVLISGEVLRQIRQHARSSSKTEVCGVLIGNDGAGGGNKIRIASCIAGQNAAQAGTHVTFTQDTWEHIYKIKDAEFPDERIVGWYHSHPGFGVFLSDHDTFIHKNFFSSPLQVAWVYDPHSDEEGCFGWIGERLERLSEISVEDAKGGEGAGETGKPEPITMGNLEEEELDAAVARAEPGKAPRWLRVLTSVLSYVTAMAVGFLIGWFIPPRILLIPIDPRTGEQVGRPIDAREALRYMQDHPELQTLPAPPATGTSPATSPPAATPNAAPGRPGSDKSGTPSERGGAKSGSDKNKDPHAP